MLRAMPSVVVQGRRIHYLDSGEGVPIVMVHSGGLSSRQWTRIAGRFAGTHRVIAPDLLGVGGSDPVPPGEFHFHEDVAMLEGLLDALGIETHHLVGHSYGGLVGVTAALRRPARVRSLSLFEPVAFGVLYSKGDEAGVRDLEDYDHDGTFFDDAVGGQEPWMERFIDWWQGPGAWRGLPDPSKQAFLRVGRKVFQEVRSLTADRTPHQAYASLTAPALLMRGGRSPIAARQVCAILAESMPNAELATFEDAGHMAPLTHGQQVGDRIVAHVRAAS
jgi:pimeloyl-ACP methyl ester carboxylesterase